VSENKQDTVPSAVPRRNRETGRGRVEKRACRRPETCKGANTRGTLHQMWLSEPREATALKQRDICHLTGKGERNRMSIV
jgi:hypothetical protein